MILHSIKMFATAIVTVLLMASCSAKFDGITTDREIVLSKKSDPVLYKYAKDDIEAQAPKSGFYPLTNHIDSMSARIMLADVAEKSIKLQYYTYNADRIGRLLLRAVLDAADRGVKVEFLIDDIELDDREDEMSALNAHENITVRAFNPTNYQGSTMHLIEIGLHSDTLGRRMHNKSFVVDNSMAVFGGRNIGDEYFGLSGEHYFVDNDILVAGPFVNKLTEEFNTYYASKYSVSYDLIKVSKLKKHLGKRNIQAIRAMINSEGLRALDDTIQSRELVKSFKKRELPLYFGEAILYFDNPNKIETDDHNSSKMIRNKISKKHSPTKSFYIMNPYFIPDAQMMKAFTKWRDKGVEIYIVTDSLDATDGKSVYAYYEDSQIPLLKLGVHLYEIHPYARREFLASQPYNLEKMEPATMIHAKTMIIDDKYFVIGSRNLDPRSRFLNTEMVAIIENKELCKFEKGYFNEIILPESSYKLSLECKSDDENDCTVIRHAIINGVSKRFEGNDNGSFWNRVTVFFAKIFPVEGLL